jgi:hypothetical protein
MSVLQVPRLHSLGDTRKAMPTVRRRSELANGKITIAIPRSRIDVQLTFVNFAALTQTPRTWRRYVPIPVIGPGVVWAGLSRLDWADLYLAIGCGWRVALALVFGFLPSFLGLLTFREHEQQQKSRLSSDGTWSLAGVFGQEDSWDKGFVDLALLCVR